MDRVLGLDGGGTKTDAAVVDRNGAVLIRKRLAGLDPTVGPQWEKVLAELSDGLSPVSAAVLGLPYHGEIAEVSARQTAVAARLFGQGAVVLNDVAVAFEGALAGKAGVLVLAGTGSMAWAQGPSGTHRVGGWGDVFGDEGSAYWIGREALGRISQQIDGRRERSGFAAEMLDRMGTDDAGLIRWVYGLENQRAGIAGLAAMVSDLAQSGRPDAIELMASAGEYLADLGLTARRLSGGPEAWSFAGSVMRDPLLQGVLTARMGVPPIPPLLPPVGGAVLAAARSAGWDVGPDFLKRLQADLTE